MRFGRAWSGAIALAIVAPVLMTACSRRKAGEIQNITPAITFSRAKAPLGSAIDVTYTWTVDATAKKLPADYRAFVHFLDSHRVLLFEDDHAPIPPTSQWEPGKTYSYTRTKFIPIYPYVGDVEVRIGLAPQDGRGERLGLKGEDTGLHEYKVAKMELLPQTENIFLVYKEGWHSPEASPQNPSLERTWTKKEGLVSFKNPRRDVVLYLEADTNAKAFKEPPVLTVSLGTNRGIVMPIESSELFLKKIKFSKEDLGDAEWVDLRLAMSESFVPRDLGMNNDPRELGLLVYHLYLGDAEELGKVSGEDVVVAGPVAPPPAPKASPAAVAAKSPAAK